MQKFFRKKTNVSENSSNIAKESFVDEMPLTETKDKNTNKEKEYVWVTGFKATDKDMCCMNMQYELSKIYILGGEPELCERGYHFCLDLKDVRKYYDFLQGGSRCFEVKALVPKKNYDYVLNHKGKLSTCTSYLMGYQAIDSKLVAKEIILTRELTNEEIYDAFIQNQGVEILGGVNYSFELFEKYRFNYDDLVKHIKDLYKEEFKSLGFSELFVQIIADKISYSQEKLNLAKALAAENVSKDIICYELLKEKVDNK